MKVRKGSKQVERIESWRSGQARRGDLAVGDVVVDPSGLEALPGLVGRDARNRADPLELAHDQVAFGVGVALISPAPTWSGKFIAFVRFGIIYTVMVVAVIAGSIVIFISPSSLTDPAMPEYERFWEL